MARLVCECGHKLWSEYWWNGSNHQWVFLDDEPTSETYGERVACCPRCGGQVAYGKRGGIGSDLDRLRKQ